MPEGLVGTRFDLGGEQEYKNALKQIRNALGSLSSGLTLATAEFKKNGDAQEYQTKRSKILKQEIESQKSAVKLCQEALKQLSDEGYGENSDKVLDWQRKLNQAQTKLVNLESELSKNEQGLDRNGKAFVSAGDQAGTMAAQLDNAGSSADELTDKLSGIGKNISLGTLSDALHSLDDTFTAVIKKAAEVGKAVYDMAIDCSVWADDLITLSAQTGIDVETLQSWQYAARFVDTNVEDIIKAFDKLNKNARSTATLQAGKSNEVKDAFTKLGVAAVTVNGQVRSSEDLFWDCVEALGKLDDATEQETISMTLFGKSYRDLLPLIKAGRDEWNRYAQEAKNSNTLTTNQVTALGKLNDSWQKLDADTQTLKNTLFAGLADAFTEINTALSTAAQSLTEFINSAEGQEAIGELKDAVIELINSFTEQDFAGVINLAKNALSGVTAAFKWIKENPDGIKAALETIAGGFAALKIAELAVDIGKVIAGLAMLKMGGTLKSLVSGGKDVVKSFFGGAAGSAAGEAAKETAKETATTAAGGGVGAWLTKTGKALLPAVTEAAKAAATVAVPTVVGAAVSMAAEDAYIKRINRFEENLPRATEAVGKITESSQDFSEAAQQNVSMMLSIVRGLNNVTKDAENSEAVAGIKDILGTLTDEQVKALQKEAPDLRLWDYLSDRGLEGSKEGIAGLINSDAVALVWTNIAEDIMNSCTDILTALSDETKEKVEEIFGGDELTDAAEEAVDQMVDALDDKKEDAANAGKDIGKSYADAMETTGDQAEAAAEESANKATKGFVEIVTTAKDDVETAGEGVGEAYAEGLEGAQDKAEQVAKETGSSSASAMDASGSAYNAGVNTMLGYAQGLYAGTGAAVDAAMHAAGAVITGWQQKMLMKSPSRLFARFGVYTMQGYALGLESGSEEAVRSMERIAGRITDAAPRSIGQPAYNMGAAPSGSARGDDMQLAQMIQNALSGIRVEIDGKDAGAILAPTINTIIGQTAAEETRYMRRGYV